MQIRIEVICEVPRELYGDNAEVSHLTFLNPFCEVLGLKPEERQVLMPQAIQGWRDAMWPADFVSPVFLRDPLPLKEGDLTDRWQRSDFRLAFNKEGVQFGIEHSIVASSTPGDGLSVIWSAELLAQTQVVIDEIRRPLQALMGNASDAVRSKWRSRPFLTVLITTVPSESDNRRLAMNWCEDQLSRVYDDSLRPTMEASTSSEFLFAGCIAPPKEFDGLVTTWKLIQNKDDSGWYMATGGHRRLLDLTGEGTIAIDFVIWLSCPPAHGSLLNTGRRCVAGYFFDLVMPIFRDTFGASRQREHIHNNLNRLAKGVKARRSRSISASSVHIANANEVASNVRRWRNNMRRHLEVIGVTVSADCVQAPVAYMEELASELEIECSRFGPEVERAQIEMDYNGGLLGWPGVILAAVALIIGFVQTWWTVIPDPISRLASKGTLQVGSAMIISLTLLAVFVTVAALAIGEYERGSGRSLSKIFALVGAAAIVLAISMCGAAFALW